LRACWLAAKFVCLASASNLWSLQATLPQPAQALPNKAGCKWQGKAEPCPSYSPCQAIAREGWQEPKGRLNVRPWAL